MTRILVCPPTHFGVEYVINPWMAGNVGAASDTVARQQWQALIEILKDIAEVTEIEPAPGLPDMCFAANGGLILEDVFVPPVFRVRQRVPEQYLYQEWAEEAGFHIEELPEDHSFEGEGDALWWPSPGSDPALWAGYGVRSSLEAHRDLAELLRIEVISLRLVDEHFYHLDTCFTPLPQGRVIYYPPAFDARSRTVIESRVRPENRFAVEEEDAIRFACNAVRIDNYFISNYASARLRAQLEAWGYTVITTPMDEFMKSGGAAKCLTLLMDQDTPDGFNKRDEVESPICSETVELEGHLLDQGIMTRAFDTITLSGGSFILEQFRAGERSDQASHARFTISAPDEAHLDEIVEQLLPYGARISTQSGEVDLATVEKDGVAPEDFYCTTIYPTDVRHNGHWVRVQKQRMDGVIVVDTDASPPTAQCTLMRNLKRGDKVVCRIGGIRVRTPDVSSTERDFAFMSSNVSSERRVEGAVDELALEMRRVRAQGGKIVVVAGPVVIHTGGGPYLARLIKGGYVQALLTGNALPVHDIETNFFGTSLGVDLKRGVGVHGGHQHHLKAINRVRAAGSIATAVESGLITGGVMYECVKAGVPYVLVGSIRDDGPLPDTLMDLIEGQEAYARAIEGADIILMLSSMLHSIGTGNMTPAGVRMVCVDISPAVVTKLADRGSVESTGIVTDVGLLLNLLASRLVPAA